jgi:hypothetical protein
LAAGSAADRQRGPDTRPIDLKEVSLVRHARFLAAGTAAVALALGIAAPFASADPGALAFACYSTSQVDPGVWSSGETDVFATWASYAPGYWAPYAETSVPTHTQIGDYYLTCNLPSGMAANGAYVSKGGSATPDEWPYIVDGSAIPGVYPVATMATPTTG